MENKTQNIVNMTGIVLNCDYTKEEKEDRLLVVLNIMTADIEEDQLINRQKHMIVFNDSASEELKYKNIQKQLKADFEKGYEKRPVFASLQGKLDKLLIEDKESFYVKSTKKNIKILEGKDRSTIDLENNVTITGKIEKIDPEPEQEYIVIVVSIDDMKLPLVINRERQTDTWEQINKTKLSVGDKIEFNSALTYETFTSRPDKNKINRTSLRPKGQIKKIQNKTQVKI